MFWQMLFFFQFDDMGFWLVPPRKKGGNMPNIPFQPNKKNTARIMMNVGNPETAFAFGQLPNEGIGLARLEFAFW